jgi:CRISPR-associated protein Cas5d
MTAPTRRRRTDDPLSPLVMEVAGDFACFTRPELKGERVSYPVMTPTAAQGVLEAVFWKPEFSYRVLKIEVLNPIRWLSIRRNEVSEAPSLRTINADGNAYHFDAAAKRSQRHTLALRDVHYRIYTQIRLAAHAESPVAKYRDQFRRRVDRGACFTHPYLGTREFSCTSFGPADPAKQPITRTEDLGVMLFGIDHAAQPIRCSWFTAHLVDGILHLPEKGLSDPEQDALTLRASTAARESEGA